MKKFLSLFVCSLALVTGLNLFAADEKVAAAKSSAIEVTGKWKLVVETGAGSGTPEFIFKQDGEKLTGTYKGILGEAAVAGLLKGDEITFSFKGNAQGQALAVDYSGKVEGTTMKGKVKLGELGEGTFTGQKQAP